MSTREQRRRVARSLAGLSPRDLERYPVALHCQCGRLIGRFVSMKAARAFYGRCRDCKARVTANRLVEKKP